MHCPLCQVDLLIAERQGIEFDYCPKCRGVWLDRGELDKIIERSASHISAERAPEGHGARRQPVSRPDREGYQNYQEQHDRHDYYRQKHKRKSFLEEVFDFD